MDEPLEPIGTGGSRGPVVAGLVVAAVLAVLVWQPWGRTTPGTPEAASLPAASPIARAASPPAAQASRPTPNVGQATPAPPSDVGTYLSLVDNEWTIVAMLATGAALSTEEPALQHGVTTVSPDGGPFLVLQQGAHPTTRRVDAIGDAKDLCTTPAIPRDRLAVSLPAGRVAYLGVTFPGMDPRATVSVSGVERSAPSFRRVPSLEVALAGLTDARRYVIPSTGPGGTVLFATTPPAILLPGTYRFEIRTPGIGGKRFLYACVGA